MNYEYSIFIINPSARAVKVCYEGRDKDGKPMGNTTLHKTIDPSVKVGDLVVIPTNTRVGQTVVEVCEVDVDVDIDATGSVPWIIDVVDRSKFDKLKSMETRAISEFKAAELRKKREEIKKNLLGEYGSVISKMEISGATFDNLNAPPALPSPPAE